MKKKESKSSKSSAKSKNKDSSDRFLLKKGDSYFIVSKFSVKSLSFQDSCLMAEDTYSAIKHQLYLDAVSGEHFIQDLKIVEALQRGLEELYLMHPVLQDYVRDQQKFKSIKESIA